MCFANSGVDLLFHTVRSCPLLDAVDADMHDVWVLGRLESRQQQALDVRLVFPVCHSVIVLLQPYKNEVYLLPKKLDEKVAKLQPPEFLGNTS